MKKTFLFLAAFAGVLLLAVFLSPFLFQILPFKFERIFNRVVMIGTLVCLAVFVRMNRESLVRYGLSWSGDSLKNLALAFLSPVLVLSIYVWIQAFFGEAVFSPRDIPAVKWLMRIITAVLTGLLIGTIEEFFFRGFIFQSLQKGLKGRLAVSLILTNIFYSILHFVNAARPFVDATPGFRDSLRLVAAPFVSLAHFGDFWPGFAGLFIFGLMLSGLLLRTKSLYASIGLHAGAVFFIKTDGLLIHFGDSNFLWGSSKMYDGVIGWAALGLLYVLLLCLFPNKNRGLQSAVPSLRS